MQFVLAEARGDLADLREKLLLREALVLPDDLVHNRLDQYLYTFIQIIVVAVVPTDLSHLLCVELIEDLRQFGLDGSGSRQRVELVFLHDCRPLLF